VQANLHSASPFSAFLDQRARKLRRLLSQEFVRYTTHLPAGWGTPREGRWTRYGLAGNQRSFLRSNTTAADDRRLVDYARQHVPIAGPNQKPSGYEPDELPDCSTARRERNSMNYRGSIWGETAHQQQQNRIIGSFLGRLLHVTT